MPQNSETNSVEVFYAPYARLFIGWFLGTLVCFGLMGCAAVQNSTPEQRYYALNGMYVATLKVANAYARDCSLGNLPPSCSGVVAKAQDAVRVAGPAFDRADTIFTTGQSQYYELSLVAAANALEAIRNILKEHIDVPANN